MKKSFSLLEIIIVILLIAIIASLAIPKLSTYSSKTNITKLKSQLAMIRNQLANKKSENILLGSEYTIDSLDDSSLDTKNLNLFTNILDISISSTSTNEKENGSWAKVSQDSYEFYISSSKKVEFSLEDEYFICKSSFEICKDFE